MWVGAQHWEVGMIQQGHPSTGEEVHRVDQLVARGHRELGSLGMCGVAHVIEAIDSMSESLPFRRTLRRPLSSTGRSVVRKRFS